MSSDRTGLAGTRLGTAPDGGADPNHELIGLARRGKEDDPRLSPAPHTDHEES